MAPVQHRHGVNWQQQQHLAHHTHGCCWPANSCPLPPLLDQPCYPSHPLRFLPVPSQVLAASDPQDIICKLEADDVLAAVGGGSGNSSFQASANPAGSCRSSYSSSGMLATGTRANLASKGCEEEEEMLVSVGVCGGISAVAQGHGGREKRKGVPTAGSFGMCRTAPSDADLTRLVRQFGATHQSAGS